MIGPVRTMIFAGSVFLMPAVAIANDQPATAPAAVENVEPAPTVFSTPPLAAEVLRTQAGREDVAMTAQSNSNATVAQNSVGDNSTTGDIRIADQAFQNLSGLALLNVNSGNNVAINASMNVNISITPGP